MADNTAGRVLLEEQKKTKLSRKAAGGVSMDQSNQNLEHHEQPQGIKIGIAGNRRKVAVLWADPRSLLGQLHAVAR